MAADDHAIERERSRAGVDAVEIDVEHTRGIG